MLIICLNARRLKAKERQKSHCESGNYVRVSVTQEIIGKAKVSSFVR
jgi:hypothetical protein